MEKTSLSARERGETRFISLPRARYVTLKSCNSVNFFKRLHLTIS